MAPVALTQKSFTARTVKDGRFTFTTAGYGFELRRLSGKGRFPVKVTLDDNEERQRLVYSTDLVPSAARFRKVTVDVSPGLGQDGDVWQVTVYTQPFQDERSMGGLEDGDGALLVRSAGAGQQFVLKGTSPALWLAGPAYSGARGTSKVLYVDTSTPQPRLSVEPTGPLDVSRYVEALLWVAMDRQFPAVADVRLVLEELPTPDAGAPVLAEVEFSGLGASGSKTKGAVKWTGDGGPYVRATLKTDDATGFQAFTFDAGGGNTVTPEMGLVTW